ncbi:MAG: glycogen-binding domain-containing protein [Deltaproteobacteria bacterium]|nr:glycogen-binding domain-containing protein [Deltaproteobacteria bacterium]
MVFPQSIRTIIPLLGIILSFASIGCHSVGYNPQQETGIPVTFTFHGHYQSVCISGDFNDWSRNQCLSHDGDGYWSTRVFLYPGKYRYGFLLDGKTRVPDPQGLIEEDDGFGNKNSVLILE